MLWWDWNLASHRSLLNDLPAGKEPYKLSHRDRWGNYLSWKTIKDRQRKPQCMRRVNATQSAKIAMGTTICTKKYSFLKNTPGDDAFSSLTPWRLSGAKICFFCFIPIDADMTGLQAIHFECLGANENSNREAKRKLLPYRGRDRRKIRSWSGKTLMMA